MKNTPGQILPGSPFGRALTHFAGRAKGHILEVGTWNGAGSTLCLASGMKIGVTLWTIEQDAKMWQAAAEAWAHNKWVKPIFGRVEEVLMAGLYGWPSLFDLVLLDGGEGQGWEDYLLVRARTPVIALDDTHTPKNQRVFEEMQDDGWTVVGEGQDRHGWAILQQEWSHWPVA